MTNDQLIGKWTAKGTHAARFDTWMIPCYEEEVMESNTHPNDLLLVHRGKWENTDHFQIWYGSEAFSDAAMHCFLCGIFETCETLELKQSLLEAFWDAWEDEAGAYSLIRDALDRRPMALASKMLDMLEMAGDSMRFTQDAVSQNSAEFKALGRWASSKYTPVPFMLNQAYYMLDYVAAEGLEDIENNFAEPDVYTTDLVYWLSQTVHNLHYVTEALHIWGSDVGDGEKLLRLAQSLAIEDTWRSLTQMLKDLLE